MDFIGACAELNYMSQIVLMMFEDPAKVCILLKMFLFFHGNLMTFLRRIVIV